MKPTVFSGPRRKYLNTLFLIFNSAKFAYKICNFFAEMFTNLENTIFKAPNHPTSQPQNPKITVFGIPLQYTRDFFNRKLYVINLRYYRYTYII